MLYDPNGRAMAAVEVVNAYFLSGPRVRMQNGRLELKNEDDDLWYTVYVKNDPSTGNAVLLLSDAGSAL